MNKQEVEQKRQMIEAELIEIGNKLGMDGRCISFTHETDAVFLDEDGGEHYFIFPPVVSDGE
jgi:hypothetical protein